MNIDRSLLKNSQNTSPNPVGAPPLPPDGRRPVAKPLQRPVPPRTSDIAPPPRHGKTRHDEPPQQHMPPSPPPAVGNTNISININLPKLHKPTLPNWNYKRIGRWIALAVALIIASLIVHAVIVAIIKHNKENAAKHRLDMIDQRKAPTFTPIVPKSSATVAKTAAYDPTRDIYSYTDTYKGMQLTVSQQRLPSGASPDATLAKIAKSINASTPIIASKGTAYVASDAGGAQTVVMGNGSLLIFVQSAFTHSTADWKSYLDTLGS